jgi:exopolyphosphatase/guanosine-5'-triphosphate,3'-diphosphate pyrophosphatase
MRVGAIDCGTNSIRLLVADVAGDGSLVDVHREMRIVRLGQGVDRTRLLAAEPLERTRAALTDYAATISESGAERVRMVATSATRDAKNRGEFVTMVHRILAVEPEVVSGHEEAALSFSGAVQTLAGLHGPVLLTDIGGGSTELVLGPEPLSAHSMDVGSVRLTERHLRNDPPTADEIRAAITDVNTALDEAGSEISLDTGAPLVGVAGTVTTLAGLALGLQEYDSSRIHGSRMTSEQVDEVTERLLSMNSEQRSRLPVIHPGRVDVIGAGALVLRTIVQRVGANEVIVSEHDILDGIALSLVG